MDPIQFLTALAAIIVIDIVLAGDNAIVIALAARRLPPHLQKRAIVWGAVGAIAVRTLMTVIVVWLLKIPGLLLAGGLALLWIAYKLLIPDEAGGSEHHPAATTFWGAMRTIIIADAVMGLDNVLAVAGAAHGSYLLVVLGLLISVPLVVWGSTFVLKIVQRWPGVVYLGAAVLAWTAVKMIKGEAFLVAWMQGAPGTAWLLWGAVPLVLAAGLVKNHRRFESRIHARLAEFAALKPRGLSSAPIESSQPREGEASMQSMQPMPSMQKASAPTGGALEVLVPVDGSANALRAVEHVIAEYRRDHALRIHLLNVQPRLSRYVSRFVGRTDRQSWHREQAEAALAPARAALERAQVPHQPHWVVGDRAQEICRVAKELGVGHIVMGTARKNSITRMVEDSVTHRVLEDTPVPVEVITGPAVARLERWGVPVAALGAAMMIVFGID